METLSLRFAEEKYGNVLYPCEQMIEGNGAPWDGGGQSQLPLVSDTQLTVGMSTAASTQNYNNSELEIYPRVTLEGYLVQHTVL